MSKYYKFTDTTLNCKEGLLIKFTDLLFHPSSPWILFPGCIPFHPFLFHSFSNFLPYSRIIFLYLSRQILSIDLLRTLPRVQPSISQHPHFPVHCTCLVPSTHIFKPWTSVSCAVSYGQHLKASTLRPNILAFTLFFFSPSLYILLSVLSLMLFFIFV